MNDDENTELTRQERIDASGSDRNTILRHLAENARATPEKIWKEVAIIFGFDDYCDFNQWHEDSWPECVLAGCIGPHVWSLLKMKAIQLGRNK